MKWTDEKAARLLKMSQAGVPSALAAQSFGTSQGRVRSVIREKFGLKWGEQGDAS
jgi:hypothetical protein